MLSGWKQIAIAGKPVDVFEPPNARPFALLWLHDEDGHTPATDAAFTAELGVRRLRCVAPHGARSWWVDRVCPEFDSVLTAERHLLDNVLPSLGKLSVAVAGVGMGGQGALRCGFRYPSRFPVVASFARLRLPRAAWPRYAARRDVREPRTARQDTQSCTSRPRLAAAHYFARAPESQWHRGNDRLHEKLGAVGVPHTAELDTVADIQALLDFVIAALDRESRRLA